MLHYFQNKLHHPDEMCSLCLEQIRLDLHQCALRLSLRNLFSVPESGTEIHEVIKMKSVFVHEQEASLLLPLFAILPAADFRGLLHLNIEILFDFQG